MSVVTLAWFELAMAHDVGVRRWSTSLAKNSQDDHAAVNYTPTQRLHSHLTGAAGEVAAAKGMGLYWPGSVGTYHDPDLPPDVQVRTRTRLTDDLCIREHDDPAHRFVLVLLDDLFRYHIVGWMPGDECRRDEWVGRSGTRRVWYVPQAELRPL